MTSTVHFLPWSKLDTFPEWIKSIGAFEHINEHEFVALKIHFGEKGNQGYIKPSLARKVVEHVKERNAYPFLTDANTIYVGQRADAVHHTMVAAAHEYTVGKCACPIIIADGLRGNSGENVEVNLKHFKTVSIANAVHYADSLIFLTHFKGHEISGFGGTLKNAGMGCGTRAGKYAMHDKLHPRVNIEKCVGCAKCIKWCSAKALEIKNQKISLNIEKCVGCGECILSCHKSVFMLPWDEKTSNVQEKIVEYAYGVLKNKRSFSINFLNFITQFCDCYPTKAKPMIEDIGILAGSDPVAVDQASADMVNSKYGKDFWKHIFPNIDWSVQLEYAEKLGLGSRLYKIVE